MSSTVISGVFPRLHLRLVDTTTPEPTHRYGLSALQKEILVALFDLRNRSPIESLRLAVLAHREVRVAKKVNQMEEYVSVEPYITLNEKGLPEILDFLTRQNFLNKATARRFIERKMCECAVYSLTEKGAAAAREYKL